MRSVLNPPWWFPLAIVVGMILLASGLISVAVLERAGGYWRWVADGPEEGWRLELFKSALHILVVGIGGALLTLAGHLVLRYREALAARNALRQQFLSRMLTHYAGAKKIRRMLRVGTSVGELFDRLNEVQLALETEKKTLRAAPLFRASDSIAADVEQMEKYLGKIISECEALGSSPPAFPFPGCQELADFTGTYKNSRFRTHFAHALDRILANTQAEITSQAPA